MEFTNRFAPKPTNKKTLFENTLEQLGIQHKLIRPYRLCFVHTPNQIQDNITKEQLRIATSLGKGTIDRAIKMLKEKGFIERVGSNKTGYWKICK